MNKTQLDPVAEVLIAAYLETASYSRAFRDEHDQPPTMLAKVHHMRSIVQATLTANDRFDLGASYVEFGRVEFEDLTVGKRYLLRSDGALSIEQKMLQRDAMFETASYLTSDVVLLIHTFHKTGLDLSVAGTRHTLGSKRLVATGRPTFVSTWPYVADDSPSPFNQGAADPFGEVGGVGDIGQEGPA